LTSKNEDMNQFELQVISEKKGWGHGEVKQFGHLATTPKAITKFWHLVYRLKRLLPTWMSFWAAPPEPKFSNLPSGVIKQLENPPFSWLIFPENSICLGILHCNGSLKKTHEIPTNPSKSQQIPWNSL